ncbi:MAG: hypothetical protein NTW52_04585 [Planctomycetota bacterium]|nr:hypothetical protein [Planctomycetota bacterium]
MSEETHFATAYSFSVDAADAYAVLRVGRTTFRVQLVDFSWAGFTISAPKKWARRFKKGTSGTLSHQGTKHSISILGTAASADGNIHVSLARADGKPQPKRTIYGPSKVRPRGVQQGDAILTAASGLCILLLVLAMPGWGDSWGTSYYFTDGVNSIGRALYQMLRSFGLR